jgi:hypothetical protein
MVRRRIRWTDRAGRSLEADGWPREVAGGVRLARQRVRRVAAGAIHYGNQLAATLERGGLVVGRGLTGPTEKGHREGAQWPCSAGSIHENWASGAERVAGGRRA